MKSLKGMFFGSIFIGFFLTSSLLVDKTSHIKPSLTKFYQALYMALWMVILELIISLYYKKEISYIFLFITLVAVFLTFLFARKQVGVNDRQYLDAMIQHHSSAILTSEKILVKTHSPFVKKLAKDIIKAQEKEIAMMENYIASAGT